MSITLKLDGPDRLAASGVRLLRPVRPLIHAYPIGFACLAGTKMLQIREIKGNMVHWDLASACRRRRARASNKS